jgi:polyphosphate kinase 2 (PPK2 family)
LTIQPVCAVYPMALCMVSFKEPSAQEASHDFFWRVHARVPGARQFVIFNRSHYDGIIMPMIQDNVSSVWVEERVRQVNDFERLLVESGTTVLKICLNISREE